MSYFGLNPRVRQSGLGLAQHGRISKHGRAHARAMLVEAAWAASRAPGPLRAFFLRIRARRGHQIAAVAVARKLAVICWHLLTQETEYLWQRPALVAHKVRSMELQAGQPMRKGNKRGPSHAYRVKELRDQEIEVARQAERAYEHAVRNWQPRGSGQGPTGAAKEERRRLRGGAHTSGPRSSPRGHPCRGRISDDDWKSLGDLIRAVQLRPVRGREVHVGEDVLLGAFHQRGELRHLGAELVGDGAPLGVRGCGVILGVGGADPGRDDAALRLARVHFARNALAHGGRAQQSMAAAALRQAFLPQLGKLMDSSEDDVLAYMPFPAQHRTKLHSTNPLERLNKEVKRRADVVGIFPSEASIIRLIGAVLLEANDEWQMQHRYMGVEAMGEMLNPPPTNETLQLPPKAA